MTTGPTAKTYPSDEQYRGWKEEAEDRGMSVSEWIQAMVEAGRKKFTADVHPDRTAADLRAQLDDRQEELDRVRGRVRRLERQQRHSEVEAIKEYVADNPGCTYDDIQRHILNSSARRTTNQLETMQGDEIQKRDGGYYADE